MTDEWYVARGDRADGPVPFAGLRAMLADGRLAADSMVRNGAGGEWASAVAVPGLAASSPSPANESTPDPPRPPAKPAERSATAAVMMWLAVLPLIAVALVAAANVEVPSKAMGLVLTLCGAGWCYSGVRAAWAGELSGFGGRIRRKPVANRVAGVLLLAIGVRVLAAAWGDFAGGPRPTSAVGFGEGDGVVPHVAVGKDRVFHRRGLEAEAGRLGSALVETEYFGGDAPKDVYLDRRQDVWLVRFVVIEEGTTDPKHVACFRRLIGPQVAATAFPGAAVEVGLCVHSSVPAVVLPLEPHGLFRVGRTKVYYAAAAGEAAEAFARHLGTVAQRPDDGPESFLVRAADGRTVVTPLHLGADAAASDPKTAAGLRGVAGEFSRGMGGRPVRLELWTAAMEPGFAADAPEDRPFRWEDRPLPPVKKRSPHWLDTDWPTSE